MKHISTNTLRKCTKCGADARYSMERIEDVPDQYYEDKNGELQLLLREQVERVCACEAHMYFYLDNDFSVIGVYTYFIRKTLDELSGDYPQRF